MRNSIGFCGAIAVIITALAAVVSIIAYKLKSRTYKDTYDYDKIWSIG
ncbi:MAG: hypothetical protein ACI4JD_08020 [Ruminococcus sp.]